MAKLQIRQFQPRRDFPFVREQQLYLRRQLRPDTFLIALKKAEKEMAELFPTVQPKPTVAPKQKQHVVQPRPKIKAHEERCFVFSDGSTKRSCPVEGCLWGRGRKLHSDRLPHPPIEIEDEPELTEVEELSLEPPMVVAGEDESEIETEVGNDVEGEPEEIDELQSAEFFEKDGDLE